MTRDFSLYVKDIIDCIESIEDFVGEMSYEEFVSDDKTQSAVARKLEIIGEASKKIPDQLKEKHPLVPWKDMARMRDKITHFYFGLDPEIVWKVVKERLPEIKPEMKKISDGLEE